MAAAGSIVSRTHVGERHSMDRLSVHTFNFLTHASAGTVEQTLLGMRGILKKVQFISGTATPTTAYDVTLKDSKGFDLLHGLGGNIDSAVLTEIVPYRGDVAGFAAEQIMIDTDDSYLFQVTNAGNSKELTVRFFIERM